MIRPTGPLVAAVLMATLHFPATAGVHAGNPAPTFTKNLLDATGTPVAGDTISLGAFAHKVVVLNLLGYDCPFCKGDGASVELDVWQHYQALYPGRVQVVGADLWDGTPGDLNNYRNITGTTYPLLLLGTGGAGGNLTSLYGTYDNFVILNSQGIVRYHAADSWPQGNRFHLNEIRACVDSLVANIVGVPRDLPVSRARLGAGPSPFREVAEVSFEAPAGSREAQIEVFSAEGRMIRRLYRGPASSPLHLQWNGRDDSGRPVPAGIYVVRAAAGGSVLLKKLVCLH